MPRHRQRIKRSYSKKLFSRGAQRIHKKNGLRSFNMRGGIRL